MLHRLREKASSPAMIVAIVAMVFATTGSAFAARSLLTGKDIQDGTITKADLAPSAVSSAKGKRGPRGARGPRGEQGEQGPQGLIGPRGERGATGATGPQGPVGPPGTTGATGPKGDQGDQGDQGQVGNDGAPGQALQQNASSTGGPVDVGTPLAIGDSGPTFTDGADLVGDIILPAGQYRVDVTVKFSDSNAADTDLEYGVGRLFLSGTALDGTTGPNGGSSDVDTTIITGDVPDDANNTAQATASFIIQVGDDGSGGETLTLRGAIRGDEADGGSAVGHVIVSKIA